MKFLSLLEKSRKNLKIFSKKHLTFPKTCVIIMTWNKNVLIKHYSVINNQRLFIISNIKQILLKRRQHLMRKFFVNFTTENTEDNGDTLLVSPSICHA
jgi:hypothetical protein